MCGKIISLPRLLGAAPTSGRARWVWQPSSGQMFSQYFTLVIFHTTHKKKCFYITPSYIHSYSINFLLYLHYRFPFIYSFRGICFHAHYRRTQGQRPCGGLKGKTMNSSLRGRPPHHQEKKQTAESPGKRHSLLNTIVCG